MLIIIECVCLLIFIHFIFPTCPLFPRSFFPDNPTSLHWPYLLPLLSLYTFYVIIVEHLNFWIFVFSYFLYGTYFLPFVLKELCLGRPSYKSPSHLRSSLNTLILEYRAAYILQGKLMAILEKFIVPTEAVARKFVILCGCILIKDWSTMKITTLILIVGWGGSVFIWWCLVLFMGGLLHYYGQRILDSYKFHGRKYASRFQRRLLSKFRKSCRPIMIHYGRMYRIRRITLLKFFRGISTGIFRVLLVLTKKS